MTPLSRKRFLTKRHCALFLLALMSLSLFGCAEKENVVYGTVVLHPAINATFSPEVKAYYEEKFEDDVYGSFAKTLLLILSYEDTIVVKDARSAKNVTYVTDDRDVPNAVVTDKWTYYFSVLCKENDPTRENKLNQVNFPVTADVIDALFADEYCVERVKLDLFSSYVIDNEGSDYYGMTLEEALRKANASQEELLRVWMTPIYDGWTLPSMVVSVDPNDVGEDVWTTYKRRWASLGIAALARYGAIDVTTLSGAGTLAVEIPYLYTENDDARIAHKDAILNVVGYVETEADKLLSTGVSMDKNSDEYKIVMEQLKNPVFYSVCGNFLGEVEK